jgi:hypothetical protein
MQNRTSDSFNRKNLNNLKPIDSCDSVSGIITSSDSKNRLNSIKIDKVDSLKETESDNTNELATSFNYSNNKSDNDVIEKPNEPQITRIPITQVIEHYTNSTNDSKNLQFEKNSNSNNNLNKNSPLSTSSISMKLQTHSPTYLKSFNSNINNSDSHLITTVAKDTLPSPNKNLNTDTTTTTAENKRDPQSNQLRKFNGNFN